MTARHRLVAVEVGPPVPSPAPAIYGDVLTSTWSRDGDLFTVMDDTFPYAECETGSNVSVHRVRGGTDGVPADARELTIERLNDLLDFGGQGKGWDEAAFRFSSWKGSGLLEVDGRLYLGVSRHLHGPEPPPKGPGGWQGYELSYDACMICSEDGGRTWRNHRGGVSAQGAAPELGDPMFPGDRFGNPYFVQTRDVSLASQAGSDAGDAEHVYAVSVARSLNNAEKAYAARVQRRRIADLDASAWEFFAGCGDDGKARWATLERAEPILDFTGTRYDGRIGMAGVTRLVDSRRGIDRYVFPQWSWPNSGRPITHVDQYREMMARSELIIFEAPELWGPWSPVPLNGAESMIYRQCFYTPAIPTRFVAQDLSALTLFVAGFGDIDPVAMTSPHYRLQTIELRLSWGDEA